MSREIPGWNTTATQRLILPPLMIAIVTAAMIPFRASIGLVSVTALLLTAVTVSGLISTLPISLGASVASGMALNFFFMKPYGSIKIHSTEDIVGFVSYSMISILSVISISGWKSSVRIASSAETVAQQETQRAARGERRLTWLNQISHDIRTPLSTIRAVVEDMRDDVNYNVTTREELLSIAVDEIDRLDLLVGNWLMYGSMDSKPPVTSFSAVDINEVVSDSARRLSPLLRNNIVNLNCEQEIDQINGSFSEVQHLVMNLVANAQRHTPSGSSITISTFSDEQGVHLVVDDSGDGFGEYNFEDLLRPYVVGERSGSSGLGLSICAEVARRHGGSIELGVAALGGGRVSITFPRRIRRGAI